MTTNHHTSLTKELDASPADNPALSRLAPRPQHQRPKKLTAITAALVTLLATLAFSLAPTASSAQANFDITNLNMVPERGWGVADQTPLETQTSSLDVLVWDFAQIGNRMFVGGAFLNVQESKYSAPISQPYVAAFDVTTGDWISTWRPQLDRAVYSLESFNGMLIVGGEFTNVNGAPREALVALDPTTGATVNSFAGRMERPWSDKRAMVRDLQVDGSRLYAVGNFSHANGAGNIRTRAYKAARFNGANGQVDVNWKPAVTGSGVWGVDIDRARGEVHLVGYFDAVNGEASTGNFHTVTDTTGATKAGKIDIPRNFPASQPEFFDVVTGDNTVWAIGEQHVVQTLDANNHSMIAYNSTGYTSNTFAYSGGFAGGAYQAGERIGDWVFAGCHCTYSVRNGVPSHHSSVTNQRTDHRLVMAYNARSGRLYEPFKPDFYSPRDGTWAIEADTNHGCLWVGGDFHVGGVDSGQNRWLGGFGRFCPNDFAPNNGGGGHGAGAYIETGSEWTYTDSANGEPVNWTQGIANGQTGSAELGFGDGNEATTLASGQISYYFTQSFEVANAGQAGQLDLQLAADDGAVVYINGTEVLRVNMPDGPIGPNTRPLTWVGGADERLKNYTVNGNALVDGTNTVAVEVHNLWRGNGDLSFDLGLAGG